MKRYLWLGLFIPSLARAEILEERIFSGQSFYIPSVFTLNPAANPTSLTIVNVSRTKLDSESSYVINPDRSGPKVEQHATHTDLAVGGQLPIQGAAIGFSYNEFQKNFIARHEQRNEDNKEHFFNRDYRMRFTVDLTTELRGAFTFHYTSLQADLDGNFFISDADRSHYKGSISGYGIGLNYNVGRLNLGLFSNPPMRGKATVDGEQKIVTEPGIYGLDMNFRLKDNFAILFNYHGWSYKHDERDDPSQSPQDQRDIVLRGLELEQFFRKTKAIGIGGEGNLTQTLFAKVYVQKQDGVWLFDPDVVPGDNKDLETKMSYNILNGAISIRQRDFIAELSLTKFSPSIGTIEGGRGEMGMGEGGSYKRDATRLGLMLGAAF